MALPPVTPGDLEAVSDLTDLQLSPDGTRLALVETTMALATNAYRRRVLVADGDEGPFEPVGAGGGREGLPRWSPDGRQLAWVDGAAASWRVVAWSAVATGALRVVVAGWPHSIEELAWSPDGRFLAFVARQPRDPGWYAASEDRRPPRRVRHLQYQEDGVGWTADRPRQVYVVEVGGPGPERLSTGWYDDAHVAWSPDSRTLAFVSRRHPEREADCLSDVFLVDREDPRSVSQLTGTELSVARPSFGADGRLAILAMEGRDFPAPLHLALVDLPSGTVRILTAGLDRDCNPPSVGMPAPLWRGDELLALVEDAGAVHLYGVPTGGGAPRLVLGGERRITSVSASGDRLALVSSSASQPPEVSTAGEVEEVPFRSLNGGWAASRRLGPAEHMGVQPPGGPALDTWLIRPDPDLYAPPHPLLVSLQGGGTQYGYHFSHEVQSQVGAGYAVLYLNPRGSAGYGATWARAVRGPRSVTGGRGWGGDDVDDIAGAVRAVTGRCPDLDPGRIGILGGSYGALLVTWLLATTDLFRAGWAERGPYNLVALSGTNDESPWFFPSYLGVTQVDDPAEYWAHSPLRLVRDIRAPLMIVHSEEDRRCPIQQAEELFCALRILGREVELVRFPGECHELSRSGSPVHRFQRLQLMLEWFGRWLAADEKGTVATVAGEGHGSGGVSGSGGEVR